MQQPKFDGLKVFSATKMQEREVLGEKITDWLKSNPNIQVVDKIVTQSSDSEFHCLAITIFYQGELSANTSVDRQDRRSSARG